MQFVSDKLDEVRRGCNDLWREEGTGSVGWDSSASEAREMGRGWQGTGDIGTEGTEQREGLALSCARECFHSQRGILPDLRPAGSNWHMQAHQAQWRQQPCNFLNGGLVSEPHGRQNPQLHSDPTWFCLTSPSCLRFADVVSLNLMQ